MDPLVMCKVTCEVCEGQTYVICPRCDGTGADPASSSHFNATICRNCRGTGRLGCIGCEATGEVEVATESIFTPICRSRRSDNNDYRFNTERQCWQFDDGVGPWCDSANLSKLDYPSGVLYLIRNGWKEVTLETSRS